MHRIGCQNLLNANCALHADIMAYCDEIVAIGIAERVGAAESTACFC